MWWPEGVPQRPTLSDKLVDWHAFVLVGGETFIKTRNVLEIGPSFGLDTIFFAPSAKRWTVLDNAPDVLAWIAGHTHRLLPGLDLVSGDARKLPFEDDTYQLVLDFGTFDNTGDPWACYAEAVRVLSRHGILITSYANLQVLGPSDDKWEIRSAPGQLRRYLESMNMWVRYDERHDQARASMIAQKFAPMKDCKWDTTGICGCIPDVEHSASRIALV
jgi:ubiquinone/menaquinone biosynthesis C-methylase UbiE